MIRVIINIASVKYIYKMKKTFMKIKEIGFFLKSKPAWKIMHVNHKLNESSVSF